MKNTRVLLADEHEMCRIACRHVIEDTSDISVVAEAVDGDELYAKFNKLHPDIIIMEITLPGLNGLDAIRRILASNNPARILILSHQDNDAFIHRAIKMGALGYVTKCSSANEILEAIRSIAVGELFIGRKMLPKIVSQSTLGDTAAISRLSRREFDVFLLLAKGRTVDETADHLSLSPKTVRHHYGSTKRKLGVTNASSLTRIAIRAGVISA